MRIRTYKDLVVWQTAMDLVTETYRVTAAYPSEERFGLAGHTRRSSISIPSDIAEGYARRRRAEYLQHVDIAYGSAAELETQLIAAQRLGFIESTEHRVYRASHFRAGISRGKNACGTSSAIGTAGILNVLDPSIP